MYPRIIPELESEVIEIGSCPQTIKDVQPGASLDLAQVVALWDEKHIAVARMYLYGVIEARRSYEALKKLRAKKGELTREDYIVGRRASYAVNIFTREDLDYWVQRGHIFAESPTGNPLHVTGCKVFVHARTD
jgi:hypothetical protein